MAFSLPHVALFYLIFVLPQILQLVQDLKGKSASAFFQSCAFLSDVKPKDRLLGNLLEIPSRTRELEDCFSRAF